MNMMPESQTLSQSREAFRNEEYVTIIAPTIGQVMQQFHERKLASQGYSISGRVGQHKFHYAGGEHESDMFGGARMVAATFIRRA